MALGFRLLNVPSVLCSHPPKPLRKHLQNGIPPVLTDAELGLGPEGIDEVVQLSIGDCHGLDRSVAAPLVWGGADAVLYNWRKSFSHQGKKNSHLWIWVSESHCGMRDETDRLLCSWMCQSQCLEAAQ